MNLEKTLRRSAAIVGILVISLLCASLYNLIWNEVDRVRYPKNFAEYVAEYSAAYGVPEYIIYAVIKTESDFSSNVVSSAGAIGLMQLTPDTFEWISMLMKEKSDPALLYDPATNIRYGTYLLSHLYMRYNRWDTVLAAYNAGMSRVDGWLADPEISDENGNLNDIPYPETKKYIKKVNNAIDVYRRLYY